MKEFKYPALNYNAQINQSNDCSRLKYSKRSRKNLKCKLYSLDTLLSSFERFAFEILLHIKFHLWLRFLPRKDIKLQFGIVLTFAAATKRKYPNMNCTTSDKLRKHVSLVKPKMSCVLWHNPEQMAWVFLKVRTVQ